MRYKTLGNTGERVSAIGLGTWAYGNDYWGEVNDAESIRTIQQGMDLGINLFDTAPSYGHGHSEEVLGKAIAVNRKEAFIVTKCGTVRDGEKYRRNLKADSIRMELEGSLRRLGTDYIDLYLLHWPDNDTAIEDTVEEIIRMKKAGKIRYFGVSNFDTKTMQIINEMIPINCYEPQYSIINMEKTEEISYSHEHGAGCLTYGSLAAGMLSGKYKVKPEFKANDNRSSFYPYFRSPLWDKCQELIGELEIMVAKYRKPLSQLSINFVNQDERITSALIGAKTPNQIIENANACEWLIENDDLTRIMVLKKSIFEGI